MTHYPDASGDFVYSLRDMDLLIGERYRIGIISAKELSEYHLQFMTITAWLIDKKQLGDLEQQRAYTRAFQTQLLTAVTNRLQLKNPDHHPSIPYKVEEVYEAARFILQGAPSLGLSNSTSPKAQVSEPSDSIKAESIVPVLAKFTTDMLETQKNFLELLKSHGMSQKTARVVEGIL